MLKKQLWYAVGASFLAMHGMNASDRLRDMGERRGGWTDVFRMVQFGYAKIMWLQQEHQALGRDLEDSTLTLHERADREARLKECSNDIKILHLLIKSIMDHRFERSVSKETGHWVVGIMDCGPKL